MDLTAEPPGARPVKAVIARETGPGRRMVQGFVRGLMVVGLGGCQLAPSHSGGDQPGVPDNRAVFSSTGEREKAATITASSPSLQPGAPGNTLLGETEAARAAALRDELAGDFERAGRAYLAGLSGNPQLLADLRRLSAARLRVAADGSGDFETLAAAISAAEPFATIVLAAGRYVAGLEIQKAVSIVAEGAERGIVEPSEVWLDAPGTVLTHSGPWLRLMGVGLASRGSAVALELSGGVADLTDITLRGGGLRATGGLVFLSDAALRDLPGPAIELSSGSRATIKHTQLSAELSESTPVGSAAGLLLGVDCRVQASDLRISGLSPGVVVGTGASLELSSSNIYDSVGAGVEVMSGARAQLFDVLVRDGDGVGVLFRAGSQGRVERCRLRGNTGGQLRWEDGAHIEQRDNVVRND
ncbi:MAG: hypothetical protein ACI9EF_000172 [Pseudohongiellaceae bacterium]|jgi:hypothetical protein